MLRHKTKLVTSTLLVALSVLPFHARGLQQSAAGESVRMSVVAARVLNKVEVRLRWQFVRGWVPPTGVKLYRIQNGAKSLVFSGKPAPDSALPPKLCSLGLVASASAQVGSVPDLVLSRKRGESGAAKFLQRQTLVRDLDSLDSPLLNKSQRLTRAQKQSELSRLRVGSRLTPPAPPAPTPQEKAYSARAQITLASMIKPEISQNLCLGATDKQVSPGQKLTYELYEANPNGSDGKLLVSIPDFTVDQGSLPPIVGGAEFVQENEKISIRWNRPPEAVENNLLATSYFVQRKGPGLGANVFDILNEEPLIILDAADGREPVSFFQDRLKEPGIYTYEIRLVDGFGRVGNPSVLNVVARDWRRPTAPGSAAASVTGLSPFQRSRSIAIKSFDPTIFKQSNPKKSISIGWQAQVAPKGLQVKYHVYRYDLDDPDSAPVRMTSAPSDGTPLPIATETQFLKAVDQVYGEEFLDEQEDRIAKAAVSGDASKPAAIKLAQAKAKVEAERKAVKNLWATSPPLSLSFETTEVDRRYQFTVTAVYVSSGLESGETPAGVVNLPDSKPPVAPSLVSKSFNPNSLEPPSNSKPSSTPPQFSIAPKSFSNLRTGQSLGFQKQKLYQKLNVPKQDFGGKVTLGWSAVPGVTSPVYSIERKSGSTPFVEVGLSAAGATTYVDNVPRGRAKTYQYRVSAISRWNVRGAGLEIPVDVPATVQPDSPNILSVRPGADQNLVLKIAKPDESQGVSKFVVLRDGVVVGNLPVVVNQETTISFTDPNLQVGREYSYQVQAVTASGIASPTSQAIRGKPLRSSLAAPTRLVATSTSKGVSLNWAGVPDAAFYIITRRQGSEAAEVVTSDITGLAFLDFTALANRTYTYTIFALDANGNQSLGTTVEVQTGP